MRLSDESQKVPAPIQLTASSYRLRQSPLSCVIDGFVASGKLASRPKLDEADEFGVTRPTSYRHLQRPSRRTERSAEDHGLLVGWCYVP